jgi:sec-independent protein translocase protein TatB
VFNLSGSELIFLVLIALVVLGPDKLPEAMRKAGKAYADFKKMTTGFQSEMKSVLEEPMRELRETADLAKKSAMFDVNGMMGEKPVSGRMEDVKRSATPAVPVIPATPEPTPIAAAVPPAPADLGFATAAFPAANSSNGTAVEPGSDAPTAVDDTVVPVKQTLASLEVRPAAVAGGAVPRIRPVAAAPLEPAVQPTEPAAAGGPEAAGEVPA